MSRYSLAFVLLCLTLVVIFTPAALAESSASPGGFCAGTEGWQLDLSGGDPPDPQCGNGKFKVDVGGELSNEFNSFNEALDNLRSRGNKGTMWFTPVSPTPTPTATPTATPQPQNTTAPQNFCEGTVGWPVNLATDIPQDPSCGDGTYRVDVNGQLAENIDSLNQAISNLRERSDTDTGTLWFAPAPKPTPEPVPVTAPADFCQGTIAWVVNLDTQIPQNPACTPGSGTFKVDQDGLSGAMLTWQVVQLNLATRQGELAIWFTKFEKLPVPEGFCEGTIPWVLNLATQRPATPPPCDGTFTLTIDGQESEKEGWTLVSMSIENLLSGMATIWYHAPLIESFPPNGFCQGTEGWGLNLNTHFPTAVTCGKGKYLTVVDDKPSQQFTTISKAIENLRTREGEGAIWFQPEPWFTFLPTVFSPREEVHAPVNFCAGTEGWGLNLNTQYPVNPGCPKGYYLVDARSDLSDQLPSFETAVDNLRSRGGEGGIWFVPRPDPVEATAPARFCKGEAGWVINLREQIPVDPGCNKDDYLVSIGGDNTHHQSFPAAVEHIRSHGLLGTIWVD